MGALDVWIDKLWRSGTMCVFVVIVGWWGVGWVEGWVEGWGGWRNTMSPC